MTKCKYKFCERETERIYCNEDCKVAQEVLNKRFPEDEKDEKAEN